MAPEFARIGPMSIRTYSLILDLAVLITLGVLAWQGQRRATRGTAWLDAGLGALVGAVVLGRIGHVIVYWQYYSHHLDQILQLSRGGLNWHIAVLGALIGLALVCRWRGLSFREVTDVLALVLPVGAMLTYTGCLMTSCGHGYEVESLAGYPPLIVMELPDLFGVIAPRLASQVYGIVWSAIVLLLTFTLLRRIEREGVRLWLVLALLGLGAFAIGFTRGDEAPYLGALRLDQVLDLAIVVFGVLMALSMLRRTRTYTLYGPVVFTRR
jgi:phosphatidylglycerol---prolipoprotein diacylglyceryl transferase